ncbi:hypothetical protein BU17DRAFT_90708 [Hysterangium stoloniferum]|nr:hypothetical protein BU17DRAFT_90708 [Hysterangium stoloniferum]
MTSFTYLFSLIALLSFTSAPVIEWQSVKSHHTGGLLMAPMMASSASVASSVVLALVVSLVAPLVAAWKTLLLLLLRALDPLTVSLIV